MALAAGVDRSGCLGVILARLVARNPAAQRLSSPGDKLARDRDVLSGHEVFPPDTLCGRALKPDVVAGFYQIQGLLLRCFSGLVLGRDRVDAA